MKGYKLLVYGVLLFMSSNYSYGQKYDSSDEYYRNARIEEQRGKVKETIKLCKEGLKLAPDDLDLMQLLGRSYMRINQLDSARYYLKKVTDRDADNVASRHYLVNVEYQTKRYSSAICYVNELLEKTPYAKDLWLKQINIYNDMGNKVEALRALKRLCQIFPNDENIQKQYTYMLHNVVTDQGRKGDLDEAKKGYLNLLNQNPGSKDIYISLIDNEIKAGRNIDALEYVDRALVIFPNDEMLIHKKISILDKNSNYDTALEFLKLKRKEVTASYYSSIESYLLSQAVQFYQNTDAFQLHKKAYDKNKNQESFTYLLNRNFEQETYEEAMRLLNERLKRYPDSKSLLVKRAFIFKKQNDVVKFREAIKELFLKYPDDYDLKNEYSQIMLHEVKEFSAEKDYEKALISSYELLLNEEYERIGEENIYTIYVLQKDYQEALVQINDMIQKYPDNIDYLDKKTSLLEEMENFDEAILLLEQLIATGEKNSKFKKNHLYFSELYAKYLMESHQHFKVYGVFENAVSVNPKGSILLYNYAINASSYRGDYVEMIRYCELALLSYPLHIDLKIKLAAALAQLNNHAEAIAILEELILENPYNSKIRGLLIEERYKLAAIAQVNGNLSKSELLLKSIIYSDTLHKPTLQRLVNLYLQKNDTANAMKYIDKGIAAEPESSFFLYKKGLVFEIMKNYPKAHYYQKKSLGELDKVAEIKEHLKHLKNLDLKNRLVVSYLNATSDSLAFKASLASISYAKLGRKNNFGVDLNYSARRNGQGIQVNGFWSTKISPTVYTDVNLAAATQFYPKFKASASVYKSLPNEWEASMGLGYSVLQDKATLFSVLPSVEKTINEFTLKAKLNLLFSAEEKYSNVFLEAKYAIEESDDYLVAMASAGSAPYDASVDFQIDKLISFGNAMVGLGYRKRYNSKYVYGIQTNWYNYKISETVFVNQYHMFFLLQTNF